MQKNVEDIPLVELKSIAYDLTKQMQFLQNQLQLVEGELMKRAQAAEAQQPQQPVPVPPQPVPVDLASPPNGLPTGHPPTA